MLNKKIMMLTIFLVSLLAVSAVSAEDSATSDVVSAVDSINFNDENVIVGDSDSDLVSSGSSNSKNFTVLQYEIENAKNGVVNFDSSYSHVENDTVETIVVNQDNLTINGNGFIINGPGQKRIFDVYGSHITISNIVFVNCSVIDSAGGGALKWISNYGTVNNCTFIDCSVGGTVGVGSGGGAIRWDGIGGTVSNCNFINCNSTWGGAAINWKNSAGTVTNCTFINCCNDGGGAIYWNADNGTVSNCKFDNCIDAVTGTIEWASLYSVNGAVNGHIINCTFTNGSRAIDVIADYCTVSGCTFYNCSNGGYAGAVLWNGEHGVLKDSKFMDCYASYAGAVLWCYTNGTLTHCNFTDCYAMDGNGGSVYVDGGFKTFTLSDSNFINSHANTDGGAIFWKNANGNVFTLTDSNFYNCSANRTGGASSGYVNVFNSKFDECSAGQSGGAMYGSTATDCTFTNNKAIWGGAKHSYTGPTINCTFIGNTASDYGGAVVGNSITNCTFINNAANSTGGSVQDAQDVLNCNFTNSYANGSGGAINNAKSVVNCNFDNCHAKGADGGAVRFTDYGEFVDNCNFADCSANANGGAVCKGGNNGAMYNSNFINCCANGNGGAIHSNARSTVKDCYFENNHANGDGGAVKGAIAEANKFLNNSANRGGALSWSTAKHCTFFNNTATSEGNNWYDTSVPYLYMVVSDFNSTYGSEGSLFINATEEDGTPLDLAIVTIKVFKNNTLVGTFEGYTNYDWDVDLDAGEYVAEMTIDHDAYKLNKQVKPKLTINKMPTNISTSPVFTVYAGNGYLLATLAGIDGKPISGMPVSVNLNGVQNVTTDDKGQISVSTDGLTPDIYLATVTFDGTNTNYDTSSAVVNVTVGIATPVISAEPVKVVYNGNGYLVVTLNDANGDPIVGETISVNIKGTKPLKTDKDGKVKFSTNGLAPKSAAYVVTATYAGSVCYEKVTTTAKVTVKKANPKLSVKAKAFKRSDKYKKYSITLKTNQNKALYKAKVYIKVNKKTYSAVVNKKGVATFKLTKLTKKGKYSAIVTYKGNSYYNAVKSGKIKIVVK